MLKNWWRASLPGDRVFAGFAAALAVLYSMVPGETSTSVAVLQALVSWCFVPFFWVWRSRPALSAAGFTACLAAWAGTWFLALPLNSGISPWLVAAPMAVYATSRYCEDRRIPRVVTAVMFAGTFASPVMWRLLDNLELRYVGAADATYLVAIHWLLLALMYVAGARGHGAMLRRRAEEAEKLGRLHAAQEEEKLLIARELHDVLAHSLTLMKVQASAGIVASRGDARAAVEALETIRSTSDLALAEVRGIVRALRGAGDADLQPSRTLGDIPGILEGFRTAGLTVEEKLPRELPEVSALVGLAATRIVTEALTNVLRHQGPGSSVVVELEPGEALVLDITSRGTPQATRGGGAGLVGLEERARSLGGTLSAEGTPELFRVHAELPLRSDR